MTDLISLYRRRCQGLTVPFLIAGLAIGFFASLPAPAKAQSLDNVPWCQIDDPAAWRREYDALIAAGRRDLENTPCPSKAGGVGLPVELTLPMPCGRSMVFRRIDVPVQHPLDQVKGHFGRVVDIDKETRQTVLSNGAWTAPVAGTFTVARDGNGNGTTTALSRLSARSYYLAKYELTAPQWDLFQRGMFSLETPAETRDDPACQAFNADLAKTELRAIPAKGMLSWFDAISFGRSYTTWLLERDRVRIAAGQSPDLPWEQGSTGYIRLPTEAEWEFAARGGISDVTPQSRSRRYPRVPNDAGDGGLRDVSLLREVCADAPKRQSVLVGPVGQRAANAFGLHDVICNAEEIVLDLFRPTRPDGLSGQIGGVITKGGASALLREGNTIGLRREATGLFTINGEGRVGTMGVRLAISAPVFTWRRDAGSDWVDKIGNETLASAMFAARDTLLDTGIGLADGGADDLKKQVNKLEREASQRQLSQKELESRLAAVQVDIARMNVALREKAIEAVRLSIRSGVVTGTLIDRFGRNMYNAMSGVYELETDPAITAAQRENVKRLRQIIQSNKDRIDASFDLYLQLQTELAASPEAFVFAELREARRGAGGASIEVFGQFLNFFTEHHRELRRNRLQVTEDMRTRWREALDTTRALRRQDFPEYRQ